MTHVNIMKKILLVLFLLLTYNSYSQSLNYFDQAYKDHKAGKYRDALTNYNSFLRENPTANYAYHNRGLVKYHLYGIDSCFKDLEKAKELNFAMSYELLDNYEQYGSLITNEYRDKILKLKKLTPKKEFKPTYTHADSLRGALRFERTCFDVKFYNLKVSIDTTGEIDGENTIFFLVTKNTNTIQIDLVRNLKVKKILYKGEKLEYKRDENAIFISFPTQLPENSYQEITVLYYGTPKEAIEPPWQGGFVLKKDNDSNHWLGVACERLGASSWWPNKDHLSDEPDSIQITLAVPSRYKAISNGNLISERYIKYNTQKEFVWKVMNPINNYNVTFYIGNYNNFKDTLISIDGSEQLLDYYVLPYNLEKAKQYFKQTKEVIQFYENVFGKYPFWNDGFGMIESCYQGMEHQGAIAFGSNYGKEEYTRYKNNQYDYIIVHEAAHEWWGNSVSVGDMADAWIHEGFATYSEYMFLESKYGYEGYLEQVTESRKKILNWFPIVGNRDVNDNSFVGWDIYSKGAQVLHNLRCCINNDSLFFKLLKSFAVKYKKSIVSTDDFINHVNLVTGKDYTSFFQTWLYQRTIPILEYSIENRGTDILLKYRWTNTAKGFEMPFGVVINGKGIRCNGTEDWKQVVFPVNTGLAIPSQWHPNYYMLPKNSFTYFEVKKL